MKVKRSYWEDTTREIVLTLSRSEWGWHLEVHKDSGVMFEKWYSPDNLKDATQEAWSLAGLIQLQFNGDWETVE